MMAKIRPILCCTTALIELRGGAMPNDNVKGSARHELLEKLTAGRRQLRELEKSLTQLKYEWSIAKRLRHQAASEDEREKWRVQSDAFLGMVLQQESVIDELKQTIDRHQARLAELDATPDSEPEA
jgi:RNA processing factor Prp31